MAPGQGIAVGTGVATEVITGIVVGAGAEAGEGVLVHPAQMISTTMMQRNPRV
jgi:hypothetical protein